jgi:hypothetical protein
MDVISALEHALSQTHEPGLRQQLADAIERLRKRKHAAEIRTQGGEPRGE